MSTTYTGKFKFGMKIGSETYMDFELRQMTTEDMLDAELHASTATPMNYNAELAMRQLLRVGTYEGPFSVAMVRKLQPVDFNALRTGLFEVNLLGEDQSPIAKTD